MRCVCDCGCKDEYLGKEKTALSMLHEYPRCGPRCGQGDQGLYLKPAVGLLAFACGGGPCDLRLQ